jgi:hypothetical protein
MDVIPGIMLPGHFDENAKPIEYFRLLLMTNL